MNTISVYGISNCDATRKALNWHRNQNIRIDFFDHKIHGVQKAKLIYWCKKAGWQNLLNKKSTTWRSLALMDQLAATNEEGAIQLMMKYTSIIKRPVVEINNKVIVGLKDDLYSTLRNEKKI